MVVQKIDLDDTFENHRNHLRYVLKRKILNIAIDVIFVHNYQRLSTEIDR